MTLEELAHADNLQHARERYPLSTPAMVLVGAALAFLLVPLVGFGDMTLQPPDAETVRIYKENGMDAPKPKWRHDDDAFNDKGRLMLWVGVGALGLGLLWLLYRLIRRRAVFASEPELITWLKNEPSEIVKLEDVDTTYTDRRGRAALSLRGVVATRRDGRTASIHAYDPPAARAFLASLWRPATL